MLCDLGLLRAAVRHLARLSLARSCRQSFTAAARHAMPCHADWLKQKLSSRQGGRRLLGGPLLPRLLPPRPGAGWSSWLRRLKIRGTLSSE